MILKEMPTAPRYEKANKGKCEEATAHFYLFRKNKPKRNSSKSNFLRYNEDI